MLHFYHHPKSPYSQKILLLLELSGHPYDLKLIQLESGEHRKAGYRDINPFARVPAIRDGEFYLSESNAIIRYLVRKWNLHDLYPTSLEDQAKVDMWWEYCSNHINRPLLDLVWNKFLAAHYRSPSEPSQIERAYKYLYRDLPVLDRQLGKQSFLCTSSLSMADVNLMPFASYGPRVLTMQNYPHLTKWLEKMQDHQAWRNVLAFSEN
jgi:glutathione S-transferase